MRAAVELARDGHSVVLFEATDELGGQLNLARRVPGRESIGLLVDDLTRDLAASGVDVRLGIHATADTIADESPDEVVIATGAVATPRASAIDAFSALDAIVVDPGRLARRVLVVDTDGTSYASGIVLSLVVASLVVEVVTPFETLFPHVGSGYDRQLLLSTLGAAPGFGRHVHQAVEDMSGTRVTTRDLLTGEPEALDGYDAIVAVEPRTAVLPDLAVDAARVIGDALSPRNIDAAIFEAVEMAYAGAR